MSAIFVAYVSDVRGICQRCPWHMPCIMMTVGTNSEKSKRPQSTVGVATVVDIDPGGVAL
jgi:hypothetical protein